MAQHASSARSSSRQDRHRWEQTSVILSSLVRRSSRFFFLISICATHLVPMEAILFTFSNIIVYISTVLPTHLSPPPFFFTELTYLIIFVKVCFRKLTELIFVSAQSAFCMVFLVMPPLRFSARKDTSWEK